MDTMEKVSNKKRLIDADALWRKLESEHWYDNADRDEIALPLVDEAPTVDAVEVVRCKDCDHKHAVTCEGIILCTYHGKKIQMHRSDFCSYGERKEGAD